MSKTIYNDQIKVNCPLIHDENGYYHLVYKIVNTINGKIYIGKHSTKNPYDRYMGSGKGIKQAIKKYNPENFVKELLFCFIDEKEAYLKEEELVTKEFVDRDDTYNMVIGGYLNSGSWSGEKNPMYGKPGPMRGKHLSQETRDKISKTRKGKKHKPETLKKMSESQKGRKNGMYGRRGEKCPNYGRKHTLETKEKESKVKIGKNNPMYGRTGENNPMYGRRGEKCPRAKAVLKIDEFGNTITEYGCMKDCCAQEHICGNTLIKLIKNYILHNGFYFVIKPKN